MFADAATDDFYRARLDHTIDLRHSLAVLASRIPRQQIEASVAHFFSRRAHIGEALPNLNLFGMAPTPLRSKSNAGLPRTSRRTMSALLYIKHAVRATPQTATCSGINWSSPPS